MNFGTRLFKALKVSSKIKKNKKNQYKKLTWSQTVVVIARGVYVHVS